MLSLRARLLVGLVLVAAVGLVVANVVIYNQISSYLNTQVDTELSTGESAVISAINHPQVQFSSQLPLNTAVEVVSYSGNRIETVPGSFRLNLSAAQFDQIVKSASSSNSAGIAPFTGIGTTTKSQSEYRVLPDPVVVNGSASADAIAFIAIPLDSLNGTLHQLVVVELAVSAGILVLLALIGYAVVRVGMRPLREIEATADAIAKGDLSKRVERADSRTEVGRLGTSLNAMLTQIEEAFDRRTASENQLRQFLADASHELRTPITSVRGYAELFRRGAVDRPEDLARAMGRIEDESARMGLLVDDLLLLARLDQGRPLETSVVDLSLLATDTAADAQVVSADRPITLEAPDPVFVVGDEQRLRQVVANLVHNALSHTPSDTPVEVRVLSDGSRARVVVEDRGPGVPTDHAAHVFERFYRADPSRARGSGGSGLGLAIVASIAEAHGGHAWLESPADGGARFIVELPLAESTAANSSLKVEYDAAQPSS